MHLFLCTVISVLLFFAVTQPDRFAKMDNPEAVSWVRVEVDQYRVFMFVATQYMASYTGGAGTLPWTTLRLFPSAPSGIRNKGMPANWRVVVDSSGTWVACTPMSERALPAVQQLAAISTTAATLISVGSETMAFLGNASDSGNASLCSSS
jgi:hypothetical protein